METQEITEKPDNPKLKTNLIGAKKWIFLVIALIIILSIFFLILFANIQKTTENGIANVLPKTAVKVTTSSSPFPFEEMTIPYLRTKSINSKLTDIEKVSDNGNYTQYLTSYLSDNLKVNGLLTKPNGVVPAGGFPAIVFVHGYIPPNQYQTIQPSYSAYVDYLAQNGFVVFKIDLRGNGNSEGEPGGAYYSSDYIIDTLSAYSALQNSDFVNPKRIGLWGHSMAGNVLLRTFAAKPDIPAVVIWSGAGYTYLDLSEYGISDQSYRPQPSGTNRQRKRQQMRELYGDPKDGNPFWKLVAPTNYLNDLKGAIQLNHAVDDNVVSVNYSRNLNTLLDITSVSHELKEYPSGGHNITGANFNAAMQNTVNFFKKYLGV